MNFEQARFNMIEQQLRPGKVLDPDVLDTLFMVKREEFDAVTEMAQNARAENESLKQSLAALEARIAVLEGSELPAKAKKAPASASKTK